MAIVIGPTPPGTGVIQPAMFFTASKSTSPARLAVGEPVHADVDYAGPGFDHRRTDEFRPAHRGDQDVGLARHALEIP